MKVDGYYSDSIQIFEFHGSYFNGHIDCFKYDREPPLHDMHTKRQRYDFVEMWGCDFRKLLNEVIDNYTGNHSSCLHAPNPRASFFWWSDRDSEIK